MIKDLIGWLIIIIMLLYIIIKGIFEYERETKWVNIWMGDGWYQKANIYIWEVVYYKYGKKNKRKGYYKICFYN